MEGLDLGQLLVPGGFFGALAVIIVTLITARSSDRAQLSGETRDHMDRLTKERNDAVGDAETLRDELQAEVRLRIAAESKALQSEYMIARLSTELEDLRKEVRHLRDEIASLKGNADPA